MSSTDRSIIHVPVLVYFTLPLSQPDRSLLVSQLNEPNDEFLRPYPHLPKLFHESSCNDIEGKLADEVVEIHLQWVKEQEIQWNDTHGGSGSKFNSWPGSYMFVVADKQTSLQATPRKVQVVHLPSDALKGKYDMVSVRVSRAAGVVNIAHVDGWDSEGPANDPVADECTTVGVEREMSTTHSTMILSAKSDKT